MTAIQKQLQYRFLFSALFLFLLCFFCKDIKQIPPLLISLTHAEGVLFVSALFAVSAIGIFPPITLVHILCGIILPTKWGFALCILGNCLLFSLSYFVGKTVPAKCSSLILSLTDGGKKGFTAAFILRGIRIVPCRLTGVYMGRAGVPFFPYLAGSLLGALPGTVISVAMGVNLR